MDCSTASVNGESSCIQLPSKGGWKSAIYIIFVEMAERFAYYGLSANLIIYLTEVLGQPTATAAKNVNIWDGVALISPLFGAFIADSYLGRFKTIIVASVIYSTGLVLLTISVSVVPLRHRSLVFFLALYVIAVGEGGHRPSVLTFAADQFDESVPEEKKAKSSFFNWWWFGVVCGGESAVLVVIFVQDYVGWTVGFVMPTVAVALAFTIFLMGMHTYRQQAPVGSPFTRVAQVFVAAARKRGISETPDIRSSFSEDMKNGDGQAREWSLVPTNQLKFLDKAAIIDELDVSSGCRNPWRLCSRHQVEEVKHLICLIPIWLSCVVFAVALVQYSTFFVKQASVMDRTIGHRFHIPPATFIAASGFVLFISIPIYDRLFVPFARRITGHPSGITVLQRMGTGLFFTLLMMIVAAIVEARRVRSSSRGQVMKVWWLLPQYACCGLAEAFTIIGMQELFYEQMPVGIRSMGAAAYNSGIGVGSFVCSAVISIVQAISRRHGNPWIKNDLSRGHLDYFYWLLAGMSALNLGFFLWIAKRFVYKKMEFGQPS